MHHEVIINNTLKFIKDYNISLKEDLGQNFLINTSLIKRIAKDLEPNENDVVVEIGPGIGNLTEEILSYPVKLVYLLELDRRFIPLLKERFRYYNNVRIINTDALNFSFERFCNVYKQVKLIGNIPYYIATSILSRVLRLPFLVIVLTLQYELARRIIAKTKTKEYSFLTLLANYYKIPKLLYIIKNHNFFPRPKVDSAVVKFIQRQDNVSKSPEKEDKLFKLIKYAFSNRRKQLKNVLKNFCGHQNNHQNDIEVILERANINKTARPDELVLEDYIKLTYLLDKTDKANILAFNR